MRFDDKERPSFHPARRGQFLLNAAKIPRT